MLLPSPFNAIIVVGVLVLNTLWWDTCCSYHNSISGRYRLPIFIFTLRSLLNLPALWVRNRVNSDRRISPEICFKFQVSLWPTFVIHTFLSLSISVKPSGKIEAGSFFFAFPGTSLSWLPKRAARTGWPCNCSLRMQGAIRVLVYVVILPASLTGRQLPMRPPEGQGLNFD